MIVAENYSAKAICRLPGAPARQGMGMRLQATVVGHSLSVPAGASIPHMPTTDGPAFRLVAALAIGLLMGAERERRKGEGSGRSPAGIRTFAIAALLGGVSYRLGGTGLLAVTTLALAGFCAVAYWRSHTKDPGLTSETALLLAALLGGLAQHEIAIASGIAVVVTILLAARAPLHHFVRTVLSQQELTDALIFVAAVLVVLPLTPNRYLGPYGAINPRNRRPQTQRSVAIPRWKMGANCRITWHGIDGTGPEASWCTFRRSAKGRMKSSVENSAPRVDIIYDDWTPR